MVQSFDDYTHLAGNQGARGSVWQGPDHLLVVDGRGWLLSFAERYRRIDYANIQSLTLVRTQTYMWLALAWGASLALFSLFTMLALSQERYALIVLGGITAALLAGFVVHLMRGPTCACTLQTNVQVLRLRALNRMRTARPVVQRIAHLCRQRQGALAPEEITAGPEAKPILGPLTLAGAKPPWRGSRWVTATGVVMLVWGLVVMAELFIPSAPFTFLDAALGMSALALSIVSLAGALRTQMPGGLLGALWGGVALELVTGLVFFILSTVARAQQRHTGSIRINSEDAFDADKTISAVSNFGMDDAGPWGWGVVGLGAVLAVLGLLTLVLGGVKKGQSAAGESQAPPPAPPPPMGGISAS